KSQKFGAEADRKGRHPDSAPAPDEIVAHLMDEDENRKDQYEGNDISGEDSKQCHQFSRLTVLSRHSPAGATHQTPNRKPATEIPTWPAREPYTRVRRNT